MRNNALARLAAIILAGSAAISAAANPASTHLWYRGEVISDSSSDESIVKGDEACFRNDFVAAMSLYRTAANKRDAGTQASAETRIGILYEWGLGVPRDFAEAWKWFLEAANRGDGFAQAYIGDYYFRGIGRSRSFTDALHWYRAAADKGVPLGISQVGWIYLNGFGVAPDLAEARRWYKKGAMLDSPASEYQLGWMYGHIAPLDYAEAMKWYRKAAGHGHATAQNNIGFLYENGLGVQVDYRAAAKWYSVAASADEPRSMFHLGTLYERGLGVQRDPTMAEYYMKQAALAGDGDALKWLAAYWWRTAAQWALVGIVITVLMGWTVRNRVTSPDGVAAARMYRPANTLIGGLMGFVICAAVAIISITLPNSTATWMETAVFVGFTFMALMMLVDYFLDWCEVSAEGLNYSRQMGGRGYLRWAEVRRVRFSSVMGWIRLESNSGEVARVRLMLVGFPEFARMVLDHVPSVAIAPDALRVLQNLSKGNPAAMTATAGGTPEPS